MFQFQRELRDVRRTAVEHRPSNADKIVPLESSDYETAVLQDPAGNILPEALLADVVPLVEREELVWSDSGGHEYPYLVGHSIPLRARMNPDV